MTDKAGNQEKITYVNMLLVDGDKILMQLRDNKPEIFAPGVWSIPGGRVDDGEEPDTAVSREFEEETGYKSHPNYFRTYVYDFINGNPNTAFYFDYFDQKQEIGCFEGQKMEFMTLDEIKNAPIFPIHDKVVEDLLIYLSTKNSYGR